MRGKERRDFKQFDLNDAMWKYFPVLCVLRPRRSHKKRFFFLKTFFCEENVEHRGGILTSKRDHIDAFVVVIFVFLTHRARRWRERTNEFRFSMETNIGPTREIRLSSLIPSIYSVAVCEVRDPTIFQSMFFLPPHQNYNRLSLHFVFCNQHRSNSPETNRMHHYPPTETHTATETNIERKKKHQWNCMNHWMKCTNNKSPLLKRRTRSWRNKKKMRNCYRFIDFAMKSLEIF